MRKPSPRARLCACAALACAILLAGCQPQTRPAPTEPPVVTVAVPVERQVTDYVDFTGRTEAVDSVDVRSRVTGYLMRVYFKEGDEVKKDQVLFEIDVRPYKAEHDKARAQVKLAEANFKLASADYQRARYAASRPGAVSRQELDSYAAKEVENKASVASAEAQAESARLNVEYCTITAPVAGRISRFNKTVGNLITQDQTSLTSIVSVDPMYAYFDVDEHTALRVRQLIREGKSDSPRAGGFPVSVGLANEEGHPHRGTINFVDNQVNPRTGTIRLRGVFPNKQQVLLPGLFARVRAPIGRPHKGLLVSERALDTDLGQKVLYVVNDKNEVVARPVRVGALRDGLREITDGLEPGERVIVNGLQQVRPGVTVEPKLVDMPATLAANSRKSNKP